MSFLFTHIVLEVRKAVNSC